MPYPWTFESFLDGKNYYLPPGLYYIGDVFDVLKIDIYDESFNETGHKDGLYKCSDGLIMISEVADTNGYTGSYIGSDEFEYIVNSGTIGIASFALTNISSCEKGQVYDFPDGVNVIIDSGLFTFETDDHVLHIDTNSYAPEDESETEDLCCAFDKLLNTEMEVDT
jgi:hypothetical protein